MGRQDGEGMDRRDGEGMGAGDEALVTECLWSGNKKR